MQPDLVVLQTLMEDRIREYEIATSEILNQLPNVTEGIMQYMLSTNLHVVIVDVIMVNRYFVFTLAIADPTSPHQGFNVGMPISVALSASSPNEIVDFLIQVAADAKQEANAALPKIDKRKYH